MQVDAEPATCLNPRRSKNSKTLSMSDEAGFTVKLARSNKSVFVKEGGSILFSLMEAGVMAPFSCGHGICGTCETTVLSGEPDHRDFVLTDSER